MLKVEDYRLKVERYYIMKIILLQNGKKAYVKSDK